MENQTNKGVIFSNKTDGRTINHVKFDSVHIFYFDRIQGSMCVPNDGGCSLGMKKKHWKSEKVNVNQFLLKKLHKKLHYIAKRSLVNYKNINFVEFVEIIRNRKLLNYHRKLIKNISTMKFVVNKKIHDIFDVDRILSSFIDDNLFFQPLSIYKRRRILKRSGVTSLTIQERFDCNNIRISRQTCGCNCGDVCIPTSCECFLNGISCQVDRQTFPCSCSTPLNCNNPNGRITFNSARAKTHFLHTKMRLELEKSRYESCLVSQKIYKKSHESVLNYNSTESGNCADCQNTLYIDFLVENETGYVDKSLQERQTESQVLSTYSPHWASSSSALNLYQNISATAFSVYLNQPSQCYQSDAYNNIYNYHCSSYNKMVSHTSQANQQEFTSNINILDPITSIFRGNHEANHNLQTGNLTQVTSVPSSSSQIFNPDEAFPWSPTIYA